MTKGELKVVEKLYKALMTVGAVDRDFFYTDLEAFHKAQTIANECLKEINSKHTKLIARIFEIGE
jgi:hypothetical protein